MGNTLFSTSQLMVAVELLIFDTFTAGSNENLQDHTPDVGTSWTKEFVVGTDFSLQVLAASDVLISPETSTTGRGVGYVAAPAPSSADAEAKITFASVTSVSAEVSIHLFARYADENNFYYATVYPLLPYSEIGEFVAGVNTVLDFDEAVSFGAADVARFVVEGTSLKLYKNDTLLLEATDASISAAGNAGVGMGFLVYSGDDLDPDLQLDDFTVTEL